MSSAAWLERMPPVPGVVYAGIVWALAFAPILALTLRNRQGTQARLVSPFYALGGVVIAAVLALPAWLILITALNLSGKSDGPKAWALLALAPLGGLIAWRQVNRSVPGGVWLKRGAQVVDGMPWVKQTRALQRGFGANLLTLAGIAVRFEDETKHFKIMGTTGSGKSTAIRELIGRALQRRDRAVIADPGGDYLAHFYDPGRGDVILNPFDPRSMRWSLFDEFTERHKVDQLARSLIPAEDEWSGYARTFVSAVIWRCHELGRRDVGDLWRVVATASSEQLRALVAGTAAQPLLEEGNVRMFGSIRAVAVSALASLDYVAEQRGEGFSVREWVRSGRGVLFLPYQPEQIAALSSLVATWMRIGIFETMGMGEVVNPSEAQRRLSFVVDELDALGRINGLTDALARLRKAGGRCVLGFQSIAQVGSVHGQGEARTIVENCSNTLILRCSASEGGGTAEFASNLIGQREIVRQMVSSSESTGGAGRSSSVSYGEEHRVEHAVLAAEIEALPDRQGYLKFASANMWMKVGF